MRQPEHFGLGLKVRTQPGLCETATSFWPTHRSKAWNGKNCFKLREKKKTKTLNNHHPPSISGDIRFSTHLHFIKFQQDTKPFVTLRNPTEFNTSRRWTKSRFTTSGKENRRCRSTDKPQHKCWPTGTALREQEGEKTIENKNIAKIKAWGETERNRTKQWLTFQQQPRIQNMFVLLKKREKKMKKKKALKLSIKMMSAH